MKKEDVKKLPGRVIDVISERDGVEHYGFEKAEGCDYFIVLWPGFKPSVLNVFFSPLFNPAYGKPIPVKKPHDFRLGDDVSIILENGQSRVVKA